MQYSALPTSISTPTSLALPRSLANIQNISNGSFILFCPIIANGDHFKSAAIIRILNKDEGRKAFGMYEAEITFVNRQEQFIRYTITQDIRPTNEGTISKEGFATTAAISNEDKQKIAVGKHVWLLLFLKRGKKEPNETMWKKYPSTNILIFDG